MAALSFVDPGIPDEPRLISPTALLDLWFDIVRAIVRPNRYTVNENNITQTVDSAALGVLCPRCGSEMLHRSRRRTFRDHVFWLLRRKPYRCEECDLRFYLR